MLGRNVIFEGLWNQNEQGPALNIALFSYVHPFSLVFDDWSFMPRLEIGYSYSFFVILCIRWRADGANYLIYTTKNNNNSMSVFMLPSIDGVCHGRTRDRSNFWQYMHKIVTLWKFHKSKSQTTPQPTQPPQHTSNIDGCYVLEPFPQIKAGRHQRGEV